LPPGISLHHHIGLIGFVESGVLEEGGDGGGDAVGDTEGLGVSDIADLPIHTSFPSASRARNHPFFSSRMAKEVPFFTFPITL
jgi:hypothetical protein